MLPPPGHRQCSPGRASWLAATAPVKALEQFLVIVCHIMNVCNGYAVDGIAADRGPVI